jgi:hypothetical protein
MGCCGRGRVARRKPKLEVSGTDENGEWVLVIDDISKHKFCPDCGKQLLKSKSYDASLKESFVRVFCPSCKWSRSTKPRKVYKTGE